MNRLFQVFAYAVLIIVGGFMFGITSDGHLIKICIACNSFLTNFFGVISMITGIFGVVGVANSKRTVVNG